MNEEKLDKVIDKLGEHAVSLAEISTHLGHYNNQLEKHIKRTELLEKEVHSLWKWKYGVAGAITLAATLLQYVLKLAGL